MAVARVGIKQVRDSDLLEAVGEIGDAVGMMLPRRLSQEHDDDTTCLYLWLLDQWPTLLARALRRYARIKK